MRLKIYTGLLTLLLLTIGFMPSIGSEDKTPSKTVYRIVLNQEIMPAAWRRMKDGLAEAEARKVDYILLKVNTYGGRLDIADSIRSRLLEAEATTIAFIDNNAASAGALISIACDSIYMVSGATIGAATVVNQTGEQLPDKYQSYMRGMMRATAESQGRDPKIAEAMVDPNLLVPGVSDSGKVITFTTSEAITYGFCEGQMEDEKALFEALGVLNYEITEQKFSTIDKIIEFLLNPAVSGILMMVLIGGIYFELQSPGVGFPIAAAAIAAILFFAPHYLEGFAENWELALFVLGVILIGVEIFALPGFGIAGALGISLVLGGLTLSLIQNNSFDFSFTSGSQIGVALFRVLISFCLPILAMVVFGPSIIRSSLFQKLVLQTTEDASKGYTIHFEETDLLNKKGIAATSLRPSGKVDIDNDRYDASTEGEFIEKDTAVEVVAVKGNYLTVRNI